MVQYQQNIVIGYMEYLVMKHLVHDIGHVGMEQQPNNCASVDYCIMKMHIVVIGQKMLMVAKNIVSLIKKKFVVYIHIKKCLCVISALCNEDANGNVPLGKSCNRYWQCQGGYPRLQRCPAMLVFDRRSLRCVVPPTEDCDIPTTPTPNNGELSNNDNNQGPGGQLVCLIIITLKCFLIN